MIYPGFSGIKLGADEDAPELKIRQIENVFLEKMFAEA